MSEIRKIEHKADQQKFTELAAYCFADEIGWSNRIFPLDGEDVAFGYFNGSELSSAMISKGFTSQVFGELVPSNGISCVVTAPPFRNRNKIGQLLSYVINFDYKKGRLFSALYPFRFGFYQKFGYGSIGAAMSSIFKPQEIRFAKIPSGKFILFDGNQKQLDDLIHVYNEWVLTYNFGIKIEKPSLEKFIDQRQFDNDYIHLYYNAKGVCEGFLRYHLKTLKPFVVRMEIKKFAWINPVAFATLLYFIWTHRDQCFDVQWITPLNIPINFLTFEPRIDQRTAFAWMARPLNIKRLLELKAAQISLDNQIVFSVEDEIIAENTGTYSIQGKAVTKETFRNENFVPLDLFSSLLFGGLSLSDAVSCGILNINCGTELEKFFTLNRNNYISEMY